MQSLTIANNLEEVKRKENKTYLTPKEAAEYLRISIQSLYQFSSSGYLKPLKIGNSNRYTHEMLDSWVIEKNSPKVLKKQGRK